MENILIVGNVVEFEVKDKGVRSGLIVPSNRFQQNNTHITVKVGEAYKSYKRDSVLSARIITSN